jgi:hypothetical protein
LEIIGGFVKSKKEQNLTLKKGQNDTLKKVSVINSNITGNNQSIIYI